MFGKNFGVLDCEGEKSYGNFDWKIVRLPVTRRFILKGIFTFINHVLLKRLIVPSDLKSVST